MCKIEENQSAPKTDKVPTEKPRGTIKVLVQRYCILLVALASLAVQLIAVHLYSTFEPRTIPLDYHKRYRPQAEAILAGDGLLLHGQARTPPAYPLALAAIYAIPGTGPDTAALLLNILLMALTAAGLAAAVRRALGCRIALFTGLIFVTYPFAVYLGLGLGPEPLYLCALAFTAWLMTATMGRHPMWAALIGAAAGCTMLVKPIGLLLPLFYAGVYLIASPKSRGMTERLLRPLLVLTASVLMIMPWQMYINRHTDRLVLLSDIGRGTTLEGWTYGLTAGAGGDKANLPGDVTKLMEKVARAGNNVSAVQLYNVILRAGREQPKAFAKLAALKFIRPWYATDERWHEHTIGLIQLIYLALSATGFAVWLKEKRGVILITALLAITVCHWLMAFFTFSILRYMMPASFMIAVFSGILAGRTYQLLPRWRRKNTELI
jgi:hypothetical protein